MFKTTVITDEKMIYEGLTYMVSLPGELGDLSVMAFHAPLLSRLRKGLIDIYIDDQDKRCVSIEAGLASMLGNQLTIIIQQ